MKKVFIFFVLISVIKTSFAQSVGGSVGGSTTVCSGNNSGLLTLSGHSGNIVRWQSSTTNGASWSNISNTTVNLAYANLITTTWYRAEVVLAPSPPNISDFSAPAIITVDAPSAGTVAGSTSVCTGSNSGILSLSGTFTEVNGWESSVDGGTNWASIINTTTSENYTNLAVTTLYRATIKNGTCPAIIVSPATITVNPLSAGGSISGAMTVCASSNSGTLSLNGYIGSILRWQSSDDGGASWSNISNTTSIHNFSNITESTEYRAVVQSGNCAAANSAPAMITVSSATEGGIVSSDANVCTGINSGTLQLTDYTGSIIEWERSIDNGINWTAIANTSDTLSYSNLTVATLYRASVQSGICAIRKSIPAVITVNVLSYGGTVSGTDTVCSGSNSGTLILSGHVGSIVRWQSSDDGGVSWSNIANTTGSALYNYVNISNITAYRAVVQSGGCPAVNSSPGTISVFPLSVGGTLSPANYSACSGSNSGTIVLSGQSGNVLNWEFSTDGGITWDTIANTALSQNFLNLTGPTKYRVLVQKGQCAAAYSSLSTINVSVPSAGGIINGSDTVCTGTNNGLLTLTGYTGSIENWEYSANGGVTWSNISNTSAIQNYTNLTATINYRAVIQSGACPTANSAPATILVSPNSVGGSVLSNNFVCDSTTTGTLTLIGQSGTILNWEYSFDGGIAWNNISNTNNTQIYTGITTTTIYRAKVQSGACPEVPSSTATISLAVPVAASYSVSVTGATVIFTNSSTGNNFSSFWNFGDNTTSTVTNPAHTYITNGSYQVLLVITDSCGSDTSMQTILITGLGIDEHAYNSPDVIMYPNPFSTEAVLQISSSKFQVPGLELTMYDVFGNMVLISQVHNHKSFIKRGELPAGIYFYLLSSPHKAIATGKVAIQ